MCYILYALLKVADGCRHVLTVLPQPGQRSSDSWDGHLNFQSRSALAAFLIGVYKFNI